MLRRSQALGVIKALLESGYGTIPLLSIFTSLTARPIYNLDFEIMSGARELVSVFIKQNISLVGRSTEMATAAPGDLEVRLKCFKPSKR